MIYPLNTPPVIHEGLFSKWLFLQGNNQIENAEAVPKFDTYRLRGAQLAYSHTTTNSSRPHPSVGECLSPPLGGDLSNHFHLLMLERELRSANKSTQTANA